MLYERFMVLSSERYYGKWSDKVMVIANKLNRPSRCFSRQRLEATGLSDLHGHIEKNLGWLGLHRDRPSRFPLRNQPSSIFVCAQRHRPPHVWQTRGGLAKERRQYKRESTINRLACGAASPLPPNRSGGDQLHNCRPVLIAFSARRCTPAAAVKQGLCRYGIAICLPAAAAGVILTMIFNEAHYIFQRITKEHSDLMRKFSPQAKAAVQLLQQGGAAPACRIAHPLQESPHRLRREHPPEPGGPLEVNQAGSRLRAGAHDPERQAKGGQLPAQLEDFAACTRRLFPLVAEQASRLQPHQRRRAELHQHGLQAFSRHTHSLFLN